MSKLTKESGETYHIGEKRKGKDQKCGRGIYICIDKKAAFQSIYEGYFLNNMTHGKGRSIRSNGEYYEGEFLANSYHGQGIRKYSNGNVYQG